MMMSQNVWYFLSLLLILGSRSHGFVLSNSKTKIVLPLRAKPKKQQQRRRRFHQDAHGSQDEKQVERRVDTSSINNYNSESSISNSGIANKEFQSSPMRDEQSLSSPPPRSSRPPTPRPGNQDYMWRTSKSIDDLEASMMKRWGDDKNEFIADPREYEVVEETKSTKNKAYQKSKSRGYKKVLDPWEKQRQKREYYDEDDEGYELDDSDDAVGKLISPRPVGGRGSLDLEDSWKVPNDNNSPGYFFNPNAVTTADREPKKEKEMTILDKSKKEKTTKNKQTQQHSIEEANPKKKKKKTTKKRSPPLLDEKGKPMFLTLKQAKWQGIQKEKEDGTFEDKSQSSSWTDLGIHSSALLDNLSQMNCLGPLPVQSQSCPAILDESNKDVIIGTYTGSGKTLAFLVPLIEKLSQDSDIDEKAIQIVVVAPGRELASQITSVARDLLPTDKKVVMAIGGTPFKRNFDQIRKTKPAVVVGTPGRIAELIVGAAGDKSGKMKIAKVRALVLDEFDALLEYKPHRDPTKAILSTLQRRLPELQTVMCSATAVDMQKKIQGYIRMDPFVVQDTAEKKIRMSPTIIHGVIHVPRPQLALETIRRILHTTPMPPQVLVFCESSERVESVVKQLGEKFNIVAAPLHGNSGKQERQEVSQALRDGQVGLVVATELAARGLDAPYLTHVLNLDLPTDSSHYAHRAGRCGRGGRPGAVLNFTFRNEQRNVPAKLTNALGVELYTVETYGGKLQIIEPPAIIDGRITL